MAFVSENTQYAGAVYSYPVEGVSITDSLPRPVQTGKVETNKPRQNLGRTRLVLSTSCHYLALVLV